MKLLKAISLIIAGALIILPGAATAQTTLTLSSWLPPEHPIIVGAIKPWIEDVESATEGRVNIRFMPNPLGAPPAHFDMARDGVADITYGVHGYQPGRFVLTAIAEMPFLGNSAEVTSVAYWRVYKRYLEGAGEHEGVKVLSVFTNGPGQIFNAERPIESIDDIAGLKFRVGGGVVNQIAQELGMTPLSKPAPATYELLSRGVADGALFPAEAIDTFNVTKIIRHATRIPGGLYNTSWFFAINPARFENLSEQDQAAIMELSGENFARRVGQAWDQADTRGWRVMQEDGVEVIDATDSFIATVKERTESVEEEWITEANEPGVDGRAALKFFRAEIRELEAE